MRNLITAFAVMCVVLVAANFASAANPGQVPHNTLSQMGLAGMQPMSDVQATGIRGKSFVAAAGFSVSFVPGAISAQGAAAVGYHYASVSTSTYATAYLPFATIGTAAGGSATAIAH